MKILLVFCATFSLSSAINFACTFSVTTWTEIGNRYTCRTTPGSVSDPFLTSVTGTHLVGRNNSHVQAVAIQTCTNLNFIPRGILDFFPELMFLEFASCRVALNGDDLYEYPSLEGFSVPGNQLTRLPGNLFASTPRMRYINFQGNGIRNIGENLLEPLPHISTVNFNANTCINHMVTNSSIHCLIGLIRSQCPDLIDQETTPATRPPTTTALPGECDMHGTVCFLAEQNTEMKAELAEVKTELSEVKSELVDVKSELVEVKAKLSLVLELLQTGTSP